MRAEFHPLQALLLTVSGWVNRHQQHVIEYLVEEKHTQDHILRPRLRGGCGVRAAGSSRSTPWA